MPSVVVVAAVAAYVAHQVAQETIEVVAAQRLLPRWDLATHVGHGWLDYHLLVTGRLHVLIWDLWQQGYWPPGLSLYQLPFFLVLGGSLTSALWSSAAAFVVVAATGAAILLRERHEGGVLAAGVFASLLVSSPYLLAYASVTMTEMLGALVQLLVVFCYQAWLQHRGQRQARALAVSLTALFFVKYNYFLLLAGPLVVYEWLERTSGWTLSQRATLVWTYLRRLVLSPVAVGLLVYACALVAVFSTGGFEFRLGGQRVSVRGIGNSGLIVLYAVLLRVWYLHSRGRIDWQRLMSADPRVRPMLLWFVLPVLVWLGSPHPNHLRDFANLVINRPLGPPTVGMGTAAYVDVLRSSYFYAGWVAGFAAAGFAFAALRFRRQSPVIQWLILAVPLQFAAIGLHQTRFPRFLLLTVVLLLLVVASEVGRWLEVLRIRRAAALAMTAIALAAGVAGARRVVTDERFTSAAFEHFMDSEALRLAFDTIRAGLGPDDRMVVVGESNELSPALIRWELGPPSGIRCFPYQISGAGRLHPDDATQVLVVAPLDGSLVPLNGAHYDPARVRAIADAIGRGDLVMRGEFPLPDVHAALRLYTRGSARPATAACRS